MRHNQVVWGRTRAAIEETEKETKEPESMTHGLLKAKEDTSEKNSNFDTFYRTAVVDAHSSDLDLFRTDSSKNGSVDVRVLMRAIQSGADVVPALQKALAVQFASLGNKDTIEDDVGDVSGDDSSGDAGHDS